MKAILDKVDKLAPRERIGLTIAVFCIVCCLMDQFVVRSIVNRLKLIDARITQAEDDRLCSQRLLLREKDLKMEYGRIENAIVKAASPAEAMTGMKGEINEAAKQTGLKVNAMDQREPRLKTFCEEYVVEISKFDADMKNLASFLYRVETSPGLTRVARLNITPGKTMNSVSGSLLLAKVMVVENANRPKAVSSVAATNAPAKR